MNHKYIPMKKSILLIVALLVATTVSVAQDRKQKDTESEQKFEQLGTMLPTPNVYRTASGAPGHQYWQQKADYKMNLVLDDSNQSLTGSETITYYNNSPDTLFKAYFHLYYNAFQPGSMMDVRSRTIEVKHLKIIYINNIHKYT